MSEEIIVKIANKNIKSEIESVGFDSAYVNNVIFKYTNEQYKIFNLKAHEANILKQLCLSLGFDCAVHRDTITCKCNYTNAVINATITQLKELIRKLKMQPFRLKKLAGELEQVLYNNIEPLLVRKTTFDWSRTYIMGILNVTPDSFSDGGEYFSVEAATNKALQLIEDGADIIDIGGESTRPGSKEVSEQEEIERIIPVIKNIRNLNQDIPISVDTRNFSTAIESIEAGSDIINDVSGLEHSSELIDYIVSKKLPVIVMHSTQVPANSQSEFNECELIDELYKYLYEKVKLLSSLGLPNNKIIVDPGIGFGKTIAGNFEIIKRINEFQSLQVPILVGISRKSFISKSLTLTKEELDAATLTYNSYLINKGINIIRVHDVKNHKKNLDYLSKLF